MTDDASFPRLQAPPPPEASVPDPPEVGAAPPSRWQWRLASARSALSALTRGGLTGAGTILTLGFVLVALIGPAIAGDPLSQTTEVLEAPSSAHPFGTDHLGRDILARTVQGARLSLVVAVVSVAFGLLVALPLGMLAGYLGGSRIDELIMRAMDVLLALPLFILGLVFLGLTGTGPTEIGPIEISPAWKVIILIAIAALPLFARIARGAALVERGESYVDLLRVIGVPRRTIVTREIMVNVLPPVIAQAFVWMGIAIFAEAALSFLGLGVQPPEPTLGNLLFNASDYLLLGAWWYSFFPGVALVLAILGLNLVGDGLSDLLDRRAE